MTARFLTVRASPAARASIGAPRRWRGALRSSGAVLSLVFGLAWGIGWSAQTPFAAAQEVGIEEALPFEIPGTNDPAPDPAPALAGASESAAPQTREEKLDALFAQLKSAGDQRQATRIQGQIGRLWADSGSDTLNLLLLRGRAALKAGEPAKAKAHFSRLIAFAPEFPEGWSARATAAFVDGDYGRALADVTRVVALEPRHFAAYAGMGAIFEKMERPREALAAFRKALEINPFSAPAKAGVERLEAEVEGRDA